MTDRRASYDRRPTRPLPRAELAPTEEPTMPATPNALREHEDTVTTMVPCPTCAGCGMVSPEIAAKIEMLLRTAKEHE